MAVAAVERKQRRLGLALSGGGLRASFFHIGLLARMAELGLLRHVEVISTVSGGSILGTYYYLHLKRLLEQRADADIRDRDYVEMVDAVGESFLKTAQRNLRMRTFASPWHNLKMGLANYSRSDRIGELYDRYLYRPLFGPGRRKPIELRELKIFPKDDARGARFNPTVGHNRKRRAKAPVLLINATTLNTGNAWRFTAAWMGEWPHRDAQTWDIDKNIGLLAGDYQSIVKHQQCFPLGVAVAASAGVPVIFPPLSVSGMYPHKWRVQLVDGGVFDNQGIVGLVDCDFPCTDFIVSDASGQLEDEPTPQTPAFDVLQRSNDVLMDRVRDVTLRGLIRRAEPGSVAFVHLKRGLEACDLPYLRSPSPVQTGIGAPKTKGIHPRLQQALSRIRTDLDSFTDIEARSLMLLGYTVSESQLAALARKFKTRPLAPKPKWSFQNVAALLAQPARNPMFVRQLELARHRMGKPFLRLIKVFGFAYAIGLLGVCAVALGLLAAYLWLLWFAVELFYPDWLPMLVYTNLAKTFTFMDVLKLAGGVLAMLLIDWFSKPAGKVFRALRYLRPARLLTSVLTRFVLPLLGAVPVYIYLCTVDRYYLRQGRVPVR